MFRTARTVGSIVVMLALLPAAAQAAWHEPDGGSDPLNRDDTRAAGTPDTANVGGVPYVAWSEADGTNTEIRVGRLNAAGTGWEEVVGGPSPINRADDQNGVEPSLTGIGGVPYVAWEELDGAKSQIRVSRLNAAGTAWEEVVGGASPINHSATEDAHEPSLTSIDGIPYVAWREDSGSDRLVRVSALNDTGTDWTEVVGGSAPINASGAAFHPRLAAVAGVPYVTWAQSDGVNSEVRASRLNGAGTAWDEVEGGASPINHSSTDSAFDPALAAVGNVPYIAWVEDDGTTQQTRVSRLNSLGTEWDEVVGGASPINAAPDGSSTFPDIASIGGVPYVTWEEFDAATDQVRVSRLNQAATDWEEVVGGPSPINHAGGTNAFASSLADVGGVPYVAFVQNDGTEVIRASRLEPELSSPQTLAAQSGAFLLTRARTFGVRYPITFEYGPDSTLANRSAVTNTGEDDTDTVAVSVGDLTPGTSYSQRAIGFDGTHTTATGATVGFTTTEVATAPAGGTGGGTTGPGTTTTTTTTQLPPKLLLAVVKPKLKGRSGKRVTLSYLSTGTGSVTLEVLKGRTRVARVTGSAKIGRNKIAWNGKRGRRKASPGRYTLRLTVTGGDGQVATDRGSVTVTR